MSATSQPQIHSTTIRPDLLATAGDLPRFNNELQYTQPPNPSWKYAQKVGEASPEGKAWADGEKQGWTSIDVAGEDSRRVYALLLSGIQPRPIAFVSTVSEDGKENIAPFSFFQAVCPYPPLISFASYCGPGQRLKDTPANIKATKEFTVNIVSSPWVEQANIASIDTPPDVSEWELTGLTKEPSTHVKPPRVKESAFSMECTLFHIFDVVHPDTGNITCNVTYGLIKYIHMRNDVLSEQGLVDPTKMKAVARMGDISYGAIGSAFRLPRMSWEEDREEIERAVLESSREGKV